MLVSQRLLRLFCFCSVVLLMFVLVVGVLCVVVLLFGVVGGWVCFFVSGCGLDGRGCVWWRCLFVEGGVFYELCICVFVGWGRCV